MFFLTIRNQVFHQPFSQSTERRAEAELSLGGSSVASGQLGGWPFLLWGLSLASWAGAGLDVEVLKDVVVDLGGDPLLLQHLLNGLVSRVSSDRGVFPIGAPWLSGFQTKLKLNIASHKTRTLYNLQNIWKTHYSKTKYLLPD